MPCLGGRRKIARGGSLPGERPGTHRWCPWGQHPQCSATSGPSAGRAPGPEATMRQVSLRT
eukprot:1971752-Rhodomonas_salina.6